MIKWSIIEEYLRILNIYVSKNWVSKYVRKNLVELQGEIDKSIIMFGDINIPLSVMGRSSRKNISTDIVELNRMISQLNLIDIYKILHPATAKWKYSSSSLGTFTKIDHNLVHKTHLIKFKRVEIIYVHTTMELK